MNILVTGAAGFIGSHIVEELLREQKHTIVGIDNFYSGSKKNIDLLKSLDREKQFNFFECDICDYDKVAKVIVDYEINQVYHLAAIASVSESIKDPLKSNEVNVKGTLNVLEASRLNGVKRVVFSSSAAVYGDEPTQPKDEESIIKPISPYGYEKYMGEQYMTLYSSLYGLETIVLRYFNVYGERQLATSDYSGVISIFEKKLKDDEIINIYGDGEQYRDFVYVKDIVKANMLAMNKEELKHEVLCVGTSNTTTINELFNCLKFKYERTSQAIYKNARDGDIKESSCNNAKVMQVLGLKEFQSFKERVSEI